MINEAKDSTVRELMAIAWRMQLVCGIIELSFSMANLLFHRTSLPRATTDGVAFPNGNPIYHPVANLRENVSFF